MNRSIAIVLLAWLLGSCALLHPYRLPTPPLSPELKAQRKAAEHARKQSALAADAAARDKKKGVVPDAAPAPAAGDAAPAKEPSAANKVKYDKKTGLMKKPKLLRRRVHKEPKKPFKPFAAIRNLFHPKPKPHGKSHPAPDGAKEKE